MTFKFNRTLAKLPVTLPKVQLEEIKVSKPKLVRQPSLLDLSKIENDDKPQDAAEKLASYLSEYETKRLGESMGVSYITYISSLFGTQNPDYLFSSNRVIWD